MDGVAPHGNRARFTRRDVGRLAALGAIGGLLPAAVSGCAGSRLAAERGGPDSATVLDDLVFGIAGTVRSLDPAHAYDGDSASLYTNVYDQLLRCDATGAVHPHLAESWHQPDPVTYVYTLREGVRFWDGSPVTAQDVAYSLDRHRDDRVASESASLYANVASIAATGPREVTVRMATTDYFFRFVPALAGQVMKRSFVEQAGDDFGGPASLTMATGPYRVERYSAASGATLVRNPLWWGGRPAAERVTYQVIEDPETLRLAVQSGEVDVTRAMPPDESRRWDRLQGVRITYAPTPTVYYLTFDQRTPPWDDVHVRRAFSHAVDRTGIVDALFNGHARVPLSPVAPEYWSEIATPAEIDAFYRTLPPYAFDLAAARAELARSAHPDGFTASIRYDSSDKAMAKTLQNLAGNLATIGVTLNPVGIPRSQATAELYAHENLGLRVGIFAPDYSDPSTFLRLALDPDQMVPNGWNYANFSSPEIVELLRRQRATADPAIRRPILERLTTIMAEQQPYLPLYMLDASLTLTSRLTYGDRYSMWSLFGDQMVTHLQPST